MKHELLVPVGNYESFVAAINSGADAVYLAGKRFGARSYATNFEIDELIEVINTAHLYGVKVFVTVNTLIYDEEIDEVLSYIDILHQSNVDAVIMQDVGLINLVHKKYPNLEIHASTQMHVHNADTLKALEDLGVKRVVFARELSLDYINGIETSLQKEAFIHGAICISYSGQCLFSSALLNRSGNRGECAGMCRLPYTLMKDNEEVINTGKYLLSPKELCTIDEFKKLLDSNIYSFKIEGRMKSPLYVSVVTRIYKKLMIQYESGEELKVSDEELKLLTAIYNREFTKGYLFNDQNLMNITSPNHLGLKIGEVLEVTPKKIKIKLIEDIHQFDGVRFKKSNIGFTINFLYDKKDRLINKGLKEDIVYIDNFMNLSDVDELYLTSPHLKVETTITKKIPVTLNIYCNTGEKVKISLSDGVNIATINGEVVEEAKNSPVTEERIVTQLEKLGNTPYYVKDINSKVGNNIFISIKYLNDLRRALVDELNHLRTKRTLEYLKNDYEITAKKYENKLNVSVLARTKEQLACARDLKVDRIYVTDKELMDIDTIYRPLRDNLKYDLDNNQKYLLGDLSGIYLYPNNYGDYYLNITNRYTLDYLSKYTKLLTISPELRRNQILKLAKFNNNFEVLVYGRLELMLMKHCVINDCANCKKYSYYLKDRNNEMFPIIPNSNHGNIILNYKPLNMLNDIEEFIKGEIKNYRIELFQEGYEETKEIIEKVLNNE